MNRKWWEEVLCDALGQIVAILIAFALLVAGIRWALATEVFVDGSRLCDGRVEYLVDTKQVRIECGPIFVDGFER